MNADGSAQRKVAVGWSFDWSPDGRRLATMNDDGIEVVAVDGSARSRRVVVNDGLHRSWSVDWSPAGGKLLWNGDEGLSIISADGSGRRVVAPGGAWDAAWSPDGSKIAFADGRYLYVMNADGTEQRRLARGNWLTSPAWSPDGRTIAFQRLTTGATHFWEGSEIYVIEADGTGKRILTARVPFDAQDPVWSPDGTQVLFVCEEDCVYNKLYVLNVRTGAHRRLARGSSADWSPDGRKIAYRAFVGHNDEIFVMRATGGGHTNVTHTPRNVQDEDPHWAPATP